MTSRLVRKVIELVIHLFLVVGVPVVYLQLTTGFDEYRLPEKMPIVYVYWLAYIALIAVIYGRIQKNKKYKSPISKRRDR